MKMRYVIISENNSPNQLQEQLNCDLYTFGDEFEIEDYDFYILLYKVNKGRCSYKVIDLCSRLYDKYVALCGLGNTGFDANYTLMKTLKNNHSLVVYSKYSKTYKFDKIYNDIINKVITTDGAAYTERFVGSICRLVFRREV